MGLRGWKEGATKRGVEEGKGREKSKGGMSRGAIERFGSSEWDGVAFVLCYRAGLT